MLLESHLLMNFSLSGPDGWLRDRLDENSFTPVTRASARRSSAKWASASDQLIWRQFPLAATLQGGHRFTELLAVGFELNRWISNT